MKKNALVSTEQFEGHDLLTKKAVNNTIVGAGANGEETLKGVEGTFCFER